MTTLRLRITGAWARPQLGIGSVERLPAVLVATAAAVGFGWLLVLLMRKADGLASPSYDQAYFAQLVWNIANGNGFVSSFHPGSFLGLHFSPLLVLPAALEGLWPDARLLSILHAGAIALSVPAMWLLVRATLRPAREAGWVAAGLAATLPIWAVVQSAAKAEFHTEVLALPLALLCGWAGLTRRTALLYGTALLALAAREDQVYPIACIGLLVAARAPGRLLATPRRHGLAVVGLAAAWAVVVFGLLKPAFRAGASYDIDSYYAWLGSGLSALLAPFQQTDAVLMALRRPDGWLVAAGLVITLAGLPLLRPRWALLIAPPVVVHLLSRHLPQPLILLQYGLLLLVPAIVAAALGARRLLALPPVRRWRRARRRLRADPRWAEVSRNGRSTRGWAFAVAFAALTLPALVVAADRGSLPPFSQREAGFWNRPVALPQLRTLASTLPTNAVLAVDEGLAAALAARPVLFVFPQAPHDAYLIVDRRPYLTGRLRWVERAEWLAKLPASGRRVLADDGRFVLWSPVP